MRSRTRLFDFWYLTKLGFATKLSMDVISFFFWTFLPLARNAAASPPPLIKSFSAVQTGYSWATGAVNNTISGTIIVDASIPGQVQSQALPDGRSVHVVFNYDTVNISNAGVFSLQPFFEERVCYIYPLPVGRGYKPLVFDDALIEIWCQQAGLCMSTYNTSTYIGMSKGVDGTPCQQWRYGTSSAEMTTFCVTEAGALLDVAFDYHDKRIDVVARTHFSNFTTRIDPSDFAIPNRDLCVDLRSPTLTKDDGERLVNEAYHIATANDEALGLWSAAPSAVFEGYTLEEASSRLGLMTGFGFNLDLPTAEHLDSIEEAVRIKGGIPSTFDARNEWGHACSSVETIRNQGGLTDRNTTFGWISQSEHSKRVVEYVHLSPIAFSCVAQVTVAGVGHFLQRKYWQIVSVLRHPIAPSAICRFLRSGSSIATAPIVVAGVVCWMMPGNF